MCDVLMTRMRNFKLQVGLLVVSTFLLLETVSGNSTLFSNSASVESICKRYHRVTATKSVSYQETYMDYDHEYFRYPRVATRRNFRIEEYTKWESIEMCCDGFEPHQKAEEASTCVPICFSNCLNGTCVGPNVCSCDSGYRMEINNFTRYSECVPVCTTGCRGGSCVAPNTCSCDRGYALTEDQGSCEATCANIHDDRNFPEGCIQHSTCVAPNRCQCDAGYMAICLSSPVERYLISNTATDGPYGIPDKAVFSTQNVTCEPICEPQCGNTSTCVAPNNCRCFSGYETVPMDEQAANRSRCRPICKQTCFNGFCGSPNECTCNEGYKPHQLLNNDFCEPICAEECVNAKCSQPNRCDCMNGYEKLIIRSGPLERASPNICIPVCPGKCPNGTCVSPGQCHCDKGYATITTINHNPQLTLPQFLNSTNPQFNASGFNIINNETTSGGRSPINHLSLQTCRPFCEPKCPMGSQCIAPNQCQSGTKDNQDSEASRKVSIRMVKSVEDCGGSDDAFHVENDKCVCDYHTDGRRCTIAAPTARIFTEDTEHDDYLKNMQSIVFLANAHYRRDDIFDWPVSRCSGKWQVSVLSIKMLYTFVRWDDLCYLMADHTPGYVLGKDTGTTGFLSKIPDSLAATAPKRNCTLLCFFRTEPNCTVMESKITRSQGSGLVGGIIGTVLLITVTIGLVVVFRKSGNQLGRKIRKMRIFSAGGISRSDANMLEQSEIMDSPFNADDRSGP